MAEHSEHSPPGNSSGISRSQAQNVRRPSRKSGQPDTEWRDSRYSLLLQNKYLMDTGLHSDCSFTVGLPNEETQVFAVHRFMLSRASPVFEAMFHADMTETNSGEVRVSDCTPRIFKLMLRYVYCDEMAAENTQEALDLSYAAHKYQMVHLMDGCCNYMCGSLDGTHVWQAWTLAELTQQPNLVRRCMQVIREDTTNALNAEGFEDLTPEVIKMLVEQEELNIASEQLLVSAVVTWASHQNRPSEDENMRMILSPLLPHLRLLTLTAQEFAEGPALQDWLTSTEKTYIYTNLALPGSIGVPPPLCPTVQQRRNPLRANPTEPIERTTHILYRPCFDNKTVFNAGRMQCLMSFRVSRNSWLHGVTVSTQVLKFIGELESITPCSEGQVLEYVGMGRGRRQNVLPLPPTPCTPGQSVTVNIRQGSVESHRTVEPPRGVDPGHRIATCYIGRSRGRAFRNYDARYANPHVLHPGRSTRPPSNFLVASLSPPNYMENIEVSILTYDYNTTSMLATDTLLNMRFEASKEYNMLNILKFSQPVFIEGSDDLSEKYGALYVLCLRFLSPGYYETMESVDLLRFGTLDIKFNVAPDNCPPINHGLIKELHFSAEGL